MTGRIDHLVVTGESLAAASAHIEASLGLVPGPVGRHDAMGTENRLVSLGAQDYLEAIAIDSNACAPERPRWFGLDMAGPPRLSHWVLRVHDIDAALAEAPEGVGPAMAMQRDGYRWRISVPDDGQQPFDGMFPALIAWESEPPVEALEDNTARLVQLTISHPRAGALGWSLSMLTSDDRVVVREGPIGLSALILVDEEEKVLS